MEKYDVLGDGYIGYGSFGEVWRAECKETNELVAVKWFERGPKINENVLREVLIHKSLCHPNVIQFKEVVLSPYGLGIVMEYAKGGDLRDKILKNWSWPNEFTDGKKGLGENMARYLFQQLMSGVCYCHSMDVCHRDLKPANILLDGSDPPCLKICDFGYAKSYQLHSRPNSVVGTPPYMAPEVGLSEYDGKLADIWSCGVILYTMLVGTEPMITRETSNGKNACRFNIPCRLSREAEDLLTRMLVENPKERITIEEIKKHEWYKKKLRGNLAEATLVTEEYPSISLQHDEQIRQIVEDAEICPLKDANDDEAGEEEDFESEDEDSEL